MAANCHRNDLNTWKERDRERERKTKTIRERETDTENPREFRND